ncbi:hypothetical protein FXO37_00323 [Capsicum annuum]|nr:hypothetical protein FXO37_00323 [Capsicum annuum]
MEEEISILIQHGGEWDSEHNFNNFVVDGLILKLDCYFETFLDELTKILGVYASADIVEIKFSMKHNYTRMKIFNDWSLKWYMNLKCKSSLTDYPLCLTVKERDCDLILSSTNTITSRYYLVCKDDQCSWYLRSSSLNDQIYSSLVVIVDGSFLKATYRGTILTACAQDVEGSTNSEKPVMKGVYNV